MALILIYPALDRAKNNGVCFGQCTTWLLDIFESIAPSLEPANHARSTIMHAAYFCLSGKGLLAADLHMYKTVAYTLAQSNSCQGDFGSGTALGSHAVKAEIQQLPGLQGNSAILCGWSENPKRGGHATAFIKLKQWNDIFFYDPKFGVYRWDREVPTDLLYKTVKSFVRRKHRQHYRLDAGLHFITGRELLVNNLSAVP